MPRHQRRERIDNKMWAGFLSKWELKKEIYCLTRGKLVVKQTGFSWLVKGRWPLVNVGCEIGSTFFKLACFHFSPQGSPGPAGGTGPIGPAGVRVRTIYLFIIISLIMRIQMYSINKLFCSSNSRGLQEKKERLDPGAHLVRWYVYCRQTALIGNCAWPYDSILLWGLIGKCVDATFFGITLKP